MIVLSTLIAYNFLGVTVTSCRPVMRQTLTNLILFLRNRPSTPSKLLDDRPPVLHHLDIQLELIDLDAECRAVLDMIEHGDARNRTLVGMQPMFRQVPPRSPSPRSPRAPSWAARMAATYPPGPEPADANIRVELRRPVKLLLDAGWACSTHPRRQYGHIGKHSGS